MALDAATVASLEQCTRDLFKNNNPGAASERLGEFAPPDRQGFLRLHDLMEVTMDPYAQFFCATALIKLLDKHWNSLTNEDRLDLRGFVVEYLWKNGPNLEAFVLSEVIQLLCVLTKNGWHDHEVFQNLPGDMRRFLEENVDLMVIGLIVLQRCIAEMNTVSTRRTLTQHRKVAIAFRDNALLPIFHNSLDTLRSCVQGTLQLTPEQDDNVREQALGLAFQCLSFDFVGIFPDESSEDIATVQMPMNWKPIIQDLKNLNLFFELYHTSANEHRARQSLQCIVQLASVRRSLFQNEAERKVFLAEIMKQTIDVMDSSGIEDEGVFHELSRLLARIKANFQLTEIVGVDEYERWVEYAARITVESLTSWQFGLNADHYLLSFWSRMVATLPYLKGPKPSLLDVFVPQIVEAFVQSRIAMAKEVCHNDLYDNVLKEEEVLLSMLEGFPQLVRSFFPKIGPYMVSTLDPLLGDYVEGLGLIQGGDMSSQVLGTMDEIESQLAWMVYLMGSVVGHRLAGSSSEEEDHVDAEITARVFQCTKLVSDHIEMLQQMPNTQPLEPLEQLESAFVFFFQQFRKVYIGESAMTSSKVYTVLQELLDVPDHLAVLNIIVVKLTYNLKIWADRDTLVRSTLGLLHDLSTGYSTGKMLLKLDAIQFMINNHANEDMGFVQNVSNMKHRMTYYSALTKLLVTDPEAEVKFATFMEPMTRISEDLQALSPSRFQDSDVRMGILGWLRDLRGVLSALLNRRNYSMFFEWIYPAHADLLAGIAETCCDNVEVSLALLKLVADLVHNRSDRIMFDSSSPNGILLFKLTSRVLTTYGKYNLSVQANDNPYAEKYKGTCHCLVTLSRSLTGNYCNFGVFQLYEDPCLWDSLDVCIRMALSIPQADLMGYTRLCKAYFNVLQILFQKYMHLVIMFSTDIFLQLLQSIEMGIESTDTSVSSQSCVALDHLTSFLYREGTKNTENFDKMQQHLSEAPDLLPQLLALLMNMILFEETNNQWSISRPLLALIVTHPDDFDQLKQEVAGTLDQDRGQKLMDSFDTLMDKVQPNLENRNRDIFTQNMTTFRSQVKAFL